MVLEQEFKKAADESKKLQAKPTDDELLKVPTPTPSLSVSPPTPLRNGLQPELS